MNERCSDSIDFREIQIPLRPHYTPPPKVAKMEKTAKLNVGEGDMEQLVFLVTVC